MKKILSIILVSAILLTLSACAGTTSPTSPTAAPTEAVITPEPIATETASAIPETTETPTEIPTAVPTELPTEAPSPTPAPTATPRPEVTASPEQIQICELDPTMTIPLVNWNEYDPVLHESFLIKAAMYGDSEDPYGYDGPADYVITDGMLMVYDTWAAAIKIYDIETGEWIKNVDASAANVDPESNDARIEYYNGLYFIFCMERRVIVSIDDEGRLIDEIPAPDGRDARLWAYDGELYLLHHNAFDNDRSDYIYRNGIFEKLAAPVFKYKTDWHEDDSATVTIKHKGFKWKVEIENEWVGFYVLGADDEGNLYVKYTIKTWPDGRPNLDSSIRVYDSQSRLVAMKRFTESGGDYRIFPDVSIQLRDCTSVWFFDGTLEEMRLTALTFDE